MEAKLHGLDCFSGIGGLSKALEPWVETVAYCERDPYAQGVLLSRMLEGALDAAPIWDDVSTLRGSMLPRIDIIFGGFPCQDISVAGDGAGLEGKRSGLFFEVVRLVEETKATFVFLENVPAIRARGLDVVVEELAKLGYDCRWTTLSAQEVGAPHLRERWFLLAAHPERLKLRFEQGRSRGADWAGEAFAYEPCEATWRQAQPEFCRAHDGLQAELDSRRLRCLGNACVPLQAQEAFKELIGLAQT